jgi:hypothetical protein
VRRAVSENIMARMVVMVGLRTADPHKSNAYAVGKHLDLLWWVSGA